MTAFPYRFVAADGNTYVYYPRGQVVTYRTADPGTYTVTRSTWRALHDGPFATMVQDFSEPVVLPMDADSRARFEAVPLGDGT